MCMHCDDKYHLADSFLMLKLALHAARPNDKGNMVYNNRSKVNFIRHSRHGAVACVHSYTHDCLSKL